MSERILKCMIMMCALIGLSACAGNSSKKVRVAAPLPPLSDTTPSIAAFNAIETAAGGASRELSVNDKQPSKQCSFSSFHRQNTIGYELDDRRQIGFRVSPDIDVFDLSDTNVKVGLSFSMALGGSANKRPKCTYGSGYYGLLPYAVNNNIDVSGLTDVDTIKSYAQERMNAREQRRMEHEERAELGL